MNRSNSHRHDAIASADVAPLDSPELRRLAEARTRLENARRDVKCRRTCKKLQSASLAAQAAAVAAHNAGIGWTQIGDVLGIERANTPTGNAQIGPPPATPRETGSGRRQLSVYRSAEHVGSVDGQESVAS